MHVGATSQPACWAHTAALVPRCRRRVAAADTTGRLLGCQRCPCGCQHNPMLPQDPLRSALSILLIAVPRVVVVAGDRGMPTGEAGGGVGRKQMGDALLSALP